MASRNYLSYKFIYDDDRGNQSIKIHRSYLNQDGTEDTPTTALFLDRVINFNEKVTGTSQGLRYMLAHVGSRQLKAKIPYAPNNPLLISHAEEILQVERVECGDYVGETLIHNGSHTNI